MGRLNTIFGGVKRKASHVVRTQCNGCGQLFDDKWYEDECSDNTATGRKFSTGEHLVQCPYCNKINARNYSHVDDMIAQGRFRDNAEDQFYGTKYGPLPPDPRFNILLKEGKRFDKVKVRDLNEIKIKPRKVA